jgi:2-methylisocitrate lyase-like PEP mutase family enzyme
MSSTDDRQQVFAALHRRGCFVIPNPWDVGTARVMAACGAQALATTSGGFAFTLGRPDSGHVTRDEALTHAESIVRATPLPVTGELENGYADDPDGVAESVHLAAEVGLSGCSIEDTRMVEGHPPYDLDAAVERVVAAVDTARSLPHPFVLCARADGVLTGAYDVDEAVRRIQAFERAGADLLYVPTPPSPLDQQRIVEAVGTPVNALSAGALAGLSLADFAAMGVRRVSIGSRLASVTHAVVRDVTQALCGDGDLSGLAGAAAGDDIDALLHAGAAGA